MMTAAQRAMHDRYVSLGFTIQDRAFAGTDRTKWYFMNRPDSDERRSDFSVNLDSGVSHQMGTNQLRTIDEAEAEYGEKRNETPAIVRGLTPPGSPRTARAFLYAARQYAGQGVGRC